MSTETAADSDSFDLPLTRIMLRFAGIPPCDFALDALRHGREVARAAVHGTRITLSWDTAMEVIAYMRAHHPNEKIYAGTEAIVARMVGSMDWFVPNDDIALALTLRFG